MLSARATEPMARISPSTNEVVVANNPLIPARAREPIVAGPVIAWDHQRATPWLRENAPMTRNYLVAAIMTSN